MQLIPGILHVEEIRGRKGPFCVGILKTSIGEFKVKDSALDQFAPGEYRGDFVVERIYTKGQPWRNGFFTELIAQIAPSGYLIETESDIPPATGVPPTQAEPDPVDERSDVPAITPVVNQPTTKDIDPSESVPQGDDPDLKLFGIELYEQFVKRAPALKLDPTVDREQFRQQRDRLKASGYRFDAQMQQWVMPNNE